MSVTIPRCWPGETVVCVAAGPSATQADVDRCRGRARIIVVNRAFELAPWADAMYACDVKFWKWVKGAPAFAGQKYSIGPGASAFGVNVIKSAGRFGLSTTPTEIKTGHDSGYQAINLAVLFGVARIALLGYDMKVQGKRDHFHPPHRDNTKPPFAECLKAYKTLVLPLRDVGVEVINCSPDSALQCFPKMPIGEALKVAA